MIKRDIGPVSAYALAVEKGYEGTEEEFAVLQAESANNAAAAAESAEEAKAAAESVEAFISEISDDVDALSEDIADVSSGYALLTGVLTEGKFINKNNGRVEEYSEYGYYTFDVECFVGSTVKVKTFFDPYGSGYAFYDAAGNAIGYGGCEGAYEQTIAATIPDNAKTFAVTCALASVDDFRAMCKVNSVEDYSSVKREINDLKAGATAYINYEVVPDVYINTNGKEEALPGYNSTDFVRVGPNRAVSVSDVYAGYAASVAFYDSSKRFLSIFDDGDAGTENITAAFTTPSDCEFVRWSFRNDYTPVAKYTDVRSSGENAELEIAKIKWHIEQLEKPCIALVDDDSDINYIGGLKQVCDELGIKCTFGVIFTRLQQNAELLAVLKGYQEEGFTVVTHPDIEQAKWFPANESYDYAFCERTLVQSLVYLQQQGFLDCDHFISPGGATGTPIINLAKKWCKSACTINDGADNTAENGKYDIRRVFIENVTIEQLKSRIDLAVANKNLLVFGTHSWKAGTDENWLNLVRGALSYAIGKGVEIKTYNEAIKEREDLYTLIKILRSNE